MMESAGETPRFIAPVFSMGLFGILTLLIAAACTTSPPVTPAIVPTAEPAATAGDNSWPLSEEECEEAGGRWQQLGLIGMGCNLPTTDGGQPCSSIQDCQGLCLASDPATMEEAEAGVQIPNSDYIRQANSSGRDIEGVCSEWQSIFGCIVVVEAGSYQELCID